MTSYDWMILAIKGLFLLWVVCMAILLWVGYRNSEELEELREELKDQD